MICHPSPRHTARLSAFFALMVVSILCARAGSASAATTMAVGAPSAAGTVTVQVSSGQNVNGCKVTAAIKATDTAAQKAQKIRDAINKPGGPCADAFSASGTSADVTVQDDAHHDSKVTIDFKGGTTGERDTVVKPPGTLSWSDNSAGQLFRLVGGATGSSEDGFHSGMVWIGTPTYVAAVPTFPGESAYDVLAAARTQLLANGISGLSLAHLGADQAGLFFNLGDSDAWISFGTDDSGLDEDFSMLPLVAALEAANPGDYSEIYAPTGTPGISIQVAPGPPNSDQDLFLYGYDPAQGWQLQRIWSASLGQPLLFTPPVFIQSLRLVDAGNNPMNGTINLLNSPVANSPNSNLVLPDIALGWRDGSSAEFNPTLGLGGGAPIIINVNPGITLQSIPAAVGANHWQYIPLQVNLQPDFSRPWLYTGGNPANGFAGPTYVEISLGGIFNPSGVPILSLPVEVDFSQGGPPHVYQLNATYDASGRLTLPTLNLGHLLVQPFQIQIGVPAGGALQGARGEAGTHGVVVPSPGYFSLDGISIVNAPPSTTVGVGATARPSAASLRLSLPSPNPFANGTSVRVSGGGANLVRLAVYRLDGRRVRSLAVAGAVAAEGSVRWDGRDDSGRRLAGGTYFIRAEGASGTATRKVVMLQ